MALYCVVTDILRPRPMIIMVRYELRDDATTPHTVLEDGTVGFHINPQETVAQNQARLRTDVETYFRQLVDESTAVGQQFEQLRQQTIGFRYPQAG